MQNHQRTQRKQNNRGTHSLKHKYNAAMRILRSPTGRSTLTKEDEVTAAHAMNNISNYGFEFFPNFYIRDDVFTLVDLADKVKQENKNKH